MYRLVLLVALQTLAAEACRPPPCHWKDARPIEKYFEDAARELIAIDRKIQGNCVRNGISLMKNLFGEEEFKMVICCPGFKEEDFSVRTRNHALYISGTSCKRSFSDVRVIPDYFNVHRATWIYENDELIITMPYLSGSKLGSRYKTCDDINEATLIVPKAPRSEANEDD